MLQETKEPGTPTIKPTIHLKELSPEYHKAHKQLMLWSTILFVWEFVGIDLDKAKDTDGYAGAVIKSLKSPQAVPWVLLILVGYFLFKCSTEWAQCHLDRRRLRFAKIDFISAWIVAVAAITLYVGQALSRVQLADTVQKGGEAILIGVFLAVTSMEWIITVTVWYASGKKPSPRVISLLITLFVAMLASVVAAFLRPTLPVYVGSSLIFILTIILGIRPWLRWLDVTGIW